MAVEYDNRPVNSGYTVVDGTVIGDYNNGNPSQYVKVWMEYLVLGHTSADISANQSRISVKLYAQVIEGGSTSGMPSTSTAFNYGYAGWDDANRTYYSCTFNFNNNTLNKFFDGTLYVPHNADGTKSIHLQTVFGLNWTTTVITSGSADTNITLPKIDTYKPTTISSVSGLNYGFPTTIELSRKASNLRELVSISNGSKSFTLKTTSSSATIINWTMPYSDGGTVLVPNTTKPSPSNWTLYVATYNGSTQVGSTVTQTLTFTIRNDDTTLAPTLTAEPTVQAYNDVVTDLGTDTAVAGYSKINVIAQKAHVSLKYGATISSRVVRFANGSTESADQNNHISSISYQSGNFGWTYTVTDSRGYTVQRSGSYPFVAYTSPTLTNVSVYRGNSSGTETADGTYIYATATVSLSSVTHNRLVSFKGKVGYTGTEVSMTSGTRATLSTNASELNNYTIYLTVTDIFTSATFTQEIRANDIPIVVRYGGNGVGFGTEGYINEGEAEFGYLIRAKRGFAKLVVNNRVFGTRNFIYRDDVVNGNYTNEGVLNNNPQRITTTKIDVEPNTTYSIFVNSVYTKRVYFTYIKCWRYDGTTYIQNIDTGDVYQATFTTPSNCEKVALTMRYADDSSINNTSVYELAMAKGDTSISSGDSEYTMDGQDVAKRLWELKNTEVSIRDDRVFATCNMLDIGTIEQGGINSSTDGSEFASSKRIRTAFIPIKPNTSYALKIQGTVSFGGGCWYDSSKTRVSAVTNLSGQSGVITSPSTAYYVRIVMVNSNSADYDVRPSYVDLGQMEKDGNLSDQLYYYYPYTMTGDVVASKLRTLEYNAGDRVAQSTSLSDTGVSVTLGKKGWYIIHLEGVANNSGVQKLAMYIAYSGSNMAQLAYTESAGVGIGRMYCTFSGWIDWDNAVVKAYASYGGTTQNQINIKAKRLYD